MGTTFGRLCTTLAQSEGADTNGADTLMARWIDGLSGVDGTMGGWANKRRGDSLNLILIRKFDGCSVGFELDDWCSGIAPDTASHRN